MRVFIISGLSGSGKSIAIKQLEDSGFFCIDNLPATFLVPVVADLKKKNVKAAAIAIDARSENDFTSTFEALHQLASDGDEPRILFLTASTDELVQRYSETRRRHPLSQRLSNQTQVDTILSLQEAIEFERQLLAPLAEKSSLLDTTNLMPSQLRNWVKDFANTRQTQMTLAFESFGFKHGIPVAADLVFDVRCLPNPYYDPALRPLTGKDEPVAAFLREKDDVQDMVGDIERFIRKWLPSYIAQNRHYLTIAIGCTGGQHRSVYVAEELGRRFRDRNGVIVRHRIVDQGNIIGTEKATQSH